MTKKCVTALAAGLLLSWTAFAQDAKSVIDNASKAMGSLKSVEYSGSGFDYAIGQNVNPNSPWPKFIDKTYKRTMNFETPAYRMERTRTQGENPPRGGGQQPIVGEQMQNVPVVVTANTPWAQQLELWMMPHGFLQAAAKNNATLSSKTVNGKKYDVLTFTGQNKAKVNGYISDQNLVERVETWIDNAMLGDMLFDATYTEYKDFGGVKFPTKIVQKQGDYPILDLTITDVKPNAPVNIQAPPPQAPAAAASATSEKLGDGVYLILGGYAALAVDFKDYIVVVEGPQSEERASAIIAEAKKLIPNKPIRYVMNTHPHSDHTGGLPVLVAEGATIITQKNNEVFLERALNTPRTLLDDTLAKNPKKAEIEAVEDKKVYTDGTRTVEIYHVAPVPHSNGLMIAYIPKEKVLFQGDFSLPAKSGDPANDHVKALAPILTKLNLDFDRYINVHTSDKQTKADFWKAVNARQKAGT